MSKASPRDLGSSEHKAVTTGILGIQGRLLSSHQLRLFLVKWESRLSTHFPICCAFTPFKRKGAVGTEPEVNMHIQQFTKVTEDPLEFDNIFIFLLKVHITEVYFKLRSSSDPVPQSNPRLQ